MEICDSHSMWPSTFAGQPPCRIWWRGSNRAKKFRKPPSSRRVSRWFLHSALASSPKTEKETALIIGAVSNKAADADIVTTSQVLSLKCPLSYMRLQLPCRSLICTHIQCFDATSYLQLQEQGPQWLCPICNKSAAFDTLAVDE